MGKLKCESPNTLHDAWNQYSSVVSPEDQKRKFQMWLEHQRKNDGEFYSENTVSSYISQIEHGFRKFLNYKNYSSVFCIQSLEEIQKYKNTLFNTIGFEDFNEKAGNRALKNGIIKYEEFLSAEKNSVDYSETSSEAFGKIRFETGFESSEPRNLIYFGAPGTGKSYRLNRQVEKLLKENSNNYERVTFHPDYTYASFVGTYKPVPCVVDDKDSITYRYVPGPFMRTLVKALESGRGDNPQPFVLIIEEINRANVAAVFGDVFQLLDRNEKNTSEYCIQASEDVKKYMADRFGGQPDDYSQIKIPDSMFIWATMNSADQGVFPMDTAFKRRWDFAYLGIDENEKDLEGKTVEIANRIVEWNDLRKAINDFLASKNINEDKQLGPYFIARRIVVPENGTEINSEEFCKVFKNKVIMYLFEDAAKQKRSDLFSGCRNNKNRYSEICTEFDERGIEIFNPEILNNLNKVHDIDGTDGSSRQ